MLCKYVECRDLTPIPDPGKKMKAVGKYYNSAKKYFYLDYELVVLASVLGRSVSLEKVADFLT